MLKVALTGKKGPLQTIPLDSPLSVDLSYYPWDGLTPEALTELKQAVRYEYQEIRHATWEIGNLSAEELTHTLTIEIEEVGEYLNPPYSVGDTRYQVFGFVRLLINGHARFTWLVSGDQHHQDVRFTEGTRHYAARPRD